MTCTNFNGAGDGGYTYADFGKVAGEPEVHADGEIWHQTLWELRQRLITKYGAVAGDARAQTYITRGMELSPPFPSMIDMRNAHPPGRDRRHRGRRPVRRHQRRRRPVERFAAPRHGLLRRRAGRQRHRARSPTSRCRPPPGAPEGHAHRHGHRRRRRPSGGRRPRRDRRPQLRPRQRPRGHHRRRRQVHARRTCPTAPTRTCSSAAPATTASSRRERRRQRHHDAQLHDRAATGRSATAAARVHSFSLPDLSSDGCGPGGAIDGSQGSGWGSTSPDQQRRARAA